MRSDCIPGAVGLWDTQLPDTDTAKKNMSVIKEKEINNS